MEPERLFTSWYNSKGLECKVVGPSTKCFCDHLFKMHTSSKGKVKCTNPGCKCADFCYLPIHGSQDFKCNCKHSYQHHDVLKKNCKSCVCKAFLSSWSCTCGMKFDDHRTISQTKQAKQAKGEVVHATQGGVVSYSSMLDGAERFGHGIKQELKAKGIKVKIEEFGIGNELQGRVSALQLYNTKLKWG